MKYNISLNIMSSMFGSGSEDIYIDSVGESVGGYKDESTGRKHHMICKIKEQKKNPNLYNRVNKGFCLPFPEDYIM